MATTEAQIPTPAEAFAGPEALTVPERDAQIDAALERIAEYESEQAEIREYAQLRIDRIQQHCDSEIKRLDRDADFYRQRIELLTKDYDYGSKKSKRLAFGEFGLKKRPDRVEIVDEAAVLEFARLNNLEVKVTEKVSKAELSKLARDGVTPLPDEDGWTVVKGEDEFYFKAGG